MYFVSGHGLVGVCFDPAEEGVDNFKGKVVSPSWQKHHGLVLI